MDCVNSFNLNQSRPLDGLVGLSGALRLGNQSLEPAPVMLGRGSIGWLRYVLLQTSLIWTCFISPLYPGYGDVLATDALSAIL